jgi:hypothetical protein
MSSDQDPAGERPPDRYPPTDDERRVVSIWRSTLAFHDPRFESKKLLKLVALAIRDEAIRERMLSDGDSVLDEFSARDSLLSGVTVEFYENTPEVLKVPLPPLGGGLEERTPAFRERLRSRTSDLQTLSAFFLDDEDLGDWDDHGGGVDNGAGADHPDPDTRDSAN